MGGRAKASAGFNDFGVFSATRCVKECLAGSKDVLGRAGDSRAPDRGLRAVEGYLERRLRLKTQA